MISANGFQAGAVESAKRHKIDLITFKKIKTDELDKDNISKIVFNMKFKIPRITNTSLSLNKDDFTEQEQNKIRQNPQLVTFRDTPLLLYSAKGEILANLFTLVDSQIKSERNRINQERTANIEKIQEHEIYTILPNLETQRLIKIEKIQIRYTISEVNTSQDVIRDEEFLYIMKNIITSEEKIFSKEVVDQILEKYKLHEII